MLRALNNLPSKDLSKPFGLRTQGFLIAVGLVMVLGQARMFAQDIEAIQADCVGQYIEAMRVYAAEMYQSIVDITNTYSWYDPRRAMLVDAVGAKYQLRVQSATFQLIACTAAPIFKG